MRVAHLTTTDISLRHLVLAQLVAVREGGGEAIGISAPGPFVAELEAAGIRHVPLPASTRGMDPLADVRAAFQLWRALRRERPDVLHTHNPKPGLYGRIVGRLAGIPVVVNTVHGLYATPDDAVAKRVVVYGLEAVASRFSHAELVQNPEDLDLLRRLRIGPRRRTHLLGNGVDLDRFAPHRLPPDARGAVRAELGVTDDQVLVGTVGRLVAEKGYPELFDAVARLGDGYVLAVVGPHDPDKADTLPEGVLDRARTAGVRFLGYRADVERLYAAMDLFVLASHREGFPRAAMEAAACGLPVVATDIRGCRQVVAHGDNGLLVPVGDVAALARAIGAVGGSAESRARMGKASRAKAEAEFDEQAVVRTVLDTYAAVAARRGLAPSGGEGASPRSGRRRPVGDACKRVIDVAGAAAGLVGLAPLLGAVAVVVRVTMGRPVLFRQARPGRHGVPFTICKFRTMRGRRDAEGRLLPDGDRLTPVGRLLRATSLDELPELWNVLRGDMSLVGPRPLLVEYLDRYTPEQARRHEVRPGLTGWAQVNGRNATTWEERLALDVWYVDHRSLVLDLRILVRTLANVVRREGISAEGHATMPRFDGQATGR